MMKFFRKYTKHLLAIFMSLLLIIWLGGSALTDWLDETARSGQEQIGVAYGHPVIQQDLLLAESTQNTISRLIPYAEMPWFRLLAEMIPNEQMLDMLARQMRQQPLDKVEWYLLDEEARRKEVHITDEMIEQLMAAIPADYLNNIREQQQLSRRRINETLRSYLRIYQAVQQGTRAVKISEADIRDFIRQTQEKVKIEMVILPAQKLVDEQFQPTQEELAAHFEQYKDVRPGESEEGFGYQIPEQAQLEYIRIDVSALADKQRITELRAYNYWEANRNEFRRPTTRSETAPATQPVEPEPYETFTEAKPQVIRKLQEEAARSDAIEQANRLIRELNKPWEDQPTTQPGDFKVPPENAASRDLYTQLVDRQQNGDVFKYGRTALADRQALRTDVNVGRASLFRGTQRTVPVTEAAFLVPPLVEDPAEVEDHLQPLVRNIYETAAYPAVDDRGNTYVFRTVQAVPRQAPESWEAVRDALVKDLRSKHARQEAEQQAEQLLEQARQEGLRSAFQGMPELAAKLENEIVTPEPFSRNMMYPYGGMPQLVPSMVEMVGSNPEFIEFVFSLAESVETQPAESDQRQVGLYHDTRGNRWIVVEFVELLPVTQEEYQQQRQMAQAYQIFMDRIRFLNTWFSTENIKARSDWEETQPTGEPDEAAEEGSQPTEPSADTAA